MDLHLWTPLISSLLALAIAVKVVLQSRKRRAHWLFVMFAGNVAVWYFFTFLEYRGAHHGLILGRLTAWMAVLLPQTGVRFLRAFRVGDARQSSWLDRGTIWLAIPMAVMVATPWFDQKIPGAVMRAVISAYVVGLLMAAVSELYTRGRSTRSRLEQQRSLYLAGVGAVTTLVTTADLVPFTINGILPNVPPLGSILVLAVLYMFSEVIERQRLIDLFELAGRFLVLTALALVLAGIYYRLVDWQELIEAARPHEGPYFLNAIVASVVILILVEPLRAKVEAQIGRFFFAERFDLERAVTSLRRRLALQLEIDVMGATLMEGLQASGRVTDAALYLVDADQKAMDLTAHIGRSPPSRVELGGLSALVQMLQTQGAAVREQIEREATEREEMGDGEGARKLAVAAGILDGIGASVVLPVETDAGALTGMLAVHDDRIRDAFSPEEVQILRDLATQVSIVVENSRLHRRMRERDRLAALGEMAAGLAHEIRNPLGSIKAAAQFLENNGEGDAQQSEFLGMIVEEVGRLNRVVGSFLDYSRPYSGNPSVIVLRDAIERTAVMVRVDLPAGIDLVVEASDPALRVKMDPEHFRQVLLNLVRNAVEAMKGRGTVTISTKVPDAMGARAATDFKGVVEVHVRDTGPGIDAAVRAKMFIPFVTTKSTGTGLGLAICQRLMESAGGRIEIRASGAEGSTFVIVLPPAEAPPQLEAAA